MLLIFFTSNIASYLVDDASPILKTDAIKYIMTFRNQLTKEQLLTTLPLLENHLKHENTVVYTYAAITIEKLFSMTSFSDSAHRPVLTRMIFCHMQVTCCTIYLFASWQALYPRNYLKTNS